MSSYSRVKEANADLLEKIAILQDKNAKLEAALAQVRGIVDTHAHRAQISRQVAQNLHTMLKLMGINVPTPPEAEIELVSDELSDKERAVLLNELLRPTIKPIKIKTPNHRP